jgi:PPOX class probable F420-dependent enzyme
MSVLPAGALGDRVRSRLRDERVVWFTTVGADGTPQPNPVWFLWGGADSVLIYNRADANRVAHVAARPNVSLHFDGNGRGGDIVVLAGVARRDANHPPSHENDGYLAKYRESMVRVSGSTEQFAADYPVPIVVDIRRVRGH